MTTNNLPINITDENAFIERVFCPELEKELSKRRLKETFDTIEAQFESVEWDEAVFGSVAQQPESDELRNLVGDSITILDSSDVDFTVTGTATYRYQTVDNEDLSVDRDFKMKGTMSYTFNQIGPREHAMTCTIHNNLNVSFKE